MYQEGRADVPEFQDSYTLTLQGTPATTERQAVVIRGEDVQCIDRG